MAGGGSIQGMATILRNNKQLLRKRDTFRRGFGFGKLRKEYRKYAEGKMESEPISQKELSEIREKIVKQKRKENIISGGILVLVVCLAVAFSFKIYKNLEEYQVKENAVFVEGNTNKYLFYIEDGDKWLEKGRYHNAIFQYTLAKEIYPGEYDVNYRLALAYGGKCKYERSGCKEGRAIMENLKVKYPDKLEVWKLESYF
jgi:hypothetical protein